MFQGAGVAEWFRRQPAELLYMGSIPIPSSTTEHIDFLVYLRQHIRECTSETYIKRIGRLAKVGDADNQNRVVALVVHKR